MAPEAPFWSEGTQPHAKFPNLDISARKMSPHNLAAKSVEIVSQRNIFSDQTGIKVEINYKKKTEKHTNTWRLNMLLNNK